MTTKKKSNAVKFLDKAIGAPISFGSTLESIRLSDEISQVTFAKKFAKILGYSEAVSGELLHM